MKKQKKYYLIYQITNNLNHKIYIGKHKTDCLDDDYFGSGKHLKRAQEKYGLENFTKTILFYLQNEDEMNLLEKMVVTKEFCDRDDTYNLNVGGDGGWDYVNLSCDYGAGSQKRQAAAQKISNFWDIPENSEHLSELISSALKKKISDMSPEERESMRQRNSDAAKKSGFSKAFLGKHHSDETKQRISQAKQQNPTTREKNGAYGKHWYYDPLTNQSKLFNSDEIPDGWLKGNRSLTPEQIQAWIYSGGQSVLGKHVFHNEATGQIIFLAEEEPIPEGFIKGKGPLSDDQKKKMSATFALKPNSSKNPQYIQEKISKLRPMYEVYLNESFEAMQKKFNYKYSCPNFCMACREFLPEYMNGARRKHLTYEQVWKHFQESISI